jgi:hypothetical protein
MGERGLPPLAEQARKAVYNWLQYHPLAVPRQRETGMITVANNKGITLTPSQAAPSPLLSLPQPSQRLPVGGAAVGAPFWRGTSVFPAGLPIRQWDGVELRFIQVVSADWILWLHRNRDDV